ncbi:MAG: hypothetical protein V4637_09195, partial [Pseudomonadota bacterium]
MNYAFSLVAATAILGCASFPDAENTRTRGERMVAEAYPGMPAELTKRALQDGDQKACSRPASEKLTSDEAAQIVQSARAAMKYPGNGQLSGDWKVGERLVGDGTGMRVREGRVETVKQNGALCINCHALDPKEVNSGSLGPAL